MLRSRKAFIFNIVIVVLTIIILTYGYVRLSAKTAVDKEIGENSFELINRIQEGEKALLFLDVAAKMAVYQAVYDMQAAGGITQTSACGTYYGFNRWNSESGEPCFVDSSTAKDSLRDLFVSNLVARVASYPSADFIGNVPTAAFARGVALAAAAPMGVAAAEVPPQPAGPVCTTGQDFTRDFTYESESGFFPPGGGRVWVPAEASCAGSYPLIVYLHGCMRQTHATVHRNFGDGLSTDIIPLVKRLIQLRQSVPVILAAPSQVRGAANYMGVADSACGGSLWGGEFNPGRFVELVRSNLPSGVSISSVSFVGHSGAGCSSGAGIHKAARDVAGIFAVGQFDTCSNAVLGTSLNDKLGAGTKFLAVYANMGGTRQEQRAAIGINDAMACPSTQVSGGNMDECFSGASNNRFAFTMADRAAGGHGTALLVGMEQFLKQFFSTGETTTLGDDDSSADVSDITAVEGEAESPLSDEIES